MDELHRIASLGRHFGLTPSIVTPDQVAVPGLNPEGLVGALRVEEDANVNPVDLRMPSRITAPLDFAPRA